MKNGIYLILGVCLAIMAFIFYNQESIVANNVQKVKLPNGTLVTLNQKAEINYNKILFNIANNVYVQGEVYVNVPTGVKMGVHTLNGNVKTIADTANEFYITAEEESFVVQNFKGNLLVNSFDLEENITAGESVRTFAEKPIKKAFDSRKAPAWIK